jgi:serine/threonine protein kinase
MPLSRTKALGEEGEDHGPGNENEAAPETWDMDGFKELGQRVGLMEAKRSFRRHASRQFSTVGTPGYASPEVLQAKGHGPATDWWSIGICLYELTAGLPPFLGDSVGEILQNMLKDQVDFSLFPDEVTADCSDMVRRLLTIDPKERLGSNGAQEIKDHPWLKDIDWEFLRQEPGPFVPTLGSAEDTDYFRNGRQENLAQCMSLLTAIKTDRGDEAVAIEGDGDVMADSACAPNMNTLDVSRRSALDEDEDQTNVFIDKFLNDDEEDDDMLDEMEPPHELLGGTGSRPKEDSFNKKFSVRHLAVLKNFSYKNLVRLHSRNKAQMQRHSFFKGPGGRTRFGAAPPDLVQGQHRLSGVGGTYLRLPGRGKGAIQSAEYQTPPTINEARDFPLQSQVP